MRPTDRRKKKGVIMGSFEEVIEAALALSRQERAKLVDAVRASLDHDELPFDPSWLAEIRRRSAEYKAGKVKTIPWEQVRDRARRRARAEAKKRANKRAATDG
jgi:putative addiction module component (TIGR02574 family)